MHITHILFQCFIVPVYVFNFLMLNVPANYCIKESLLQSCLIKKGGSENLNTLNSYMRGYQNISRGTLLSFLSVGNKFETCYVSVATF